MDKEQELLKYSDPEKVSRAVRKYLGKDVELYISSRKNKKYMVQSPDGKWIHFGLFGAEDWSRHQDPIRRENFRRRNAKWATAPKWSPAFISYWTLW